MRYSYHTLSMFESCPAKFRYYTEKRVKPLPQFTIPAMEWGKKYHTIMENYYKQLLKYNTYDSSEIRTNIHIAISKLRYEIEDSSEFSYALKQFESFECDRLQWSHFKPIVIEKNYNNSQFTGRIDILFKDNQNNFILVDWKKAKFHDSYLIQAYIYNEIVNPHSIIFFFAQRGFTLTITSKQLEQGRQKVSSLLSLIQTDINEKRIGEQCKTCEYSLSCLIPSHYKNNMIMRN